MEPFLNWNIQTLLSEHSTEFTVYKFQELFSFKFQIDIEIIIFFFTCSNHIQDINGIVPR